LDDNPPISEARNIRWLAYNIKLPVLLGLNLHVNDCLRKRNIVDSVSNPWRNNTHNELELVPIEAEK